MENGDLIPFKIWQERGTKQREYIIWHALVNKISVLKKQDGMEPQINSE